MGDVVSLVEEHKNSLMKKKLEEFKENRQNEFGFDDFLTQIQQVKKWVI
jgi:signal recognition particle GTPase